MTKKFFVSALLCTALSMAGATGLAEERNTDISFIIGEDSVNINDKTIKVIAPYIINDTTLVPLRVVSEGFGAEVSWNEETESVTVKSDDKTIIIKIGSNTAEVNGEECKLVAAAEIKDDTAMVPIRFISEALGANVKWEQSSMRVTISNKSEDLLNLLKIDNSKWKYNEEDGVYWQVGIEYCANPVDKEYQTMGIFVPEQYMNAKDNNDGTYTCTINHDAEVNGYNSSTAPIVIPVNTPGYSAMKAPTDYSKNVKSYTDAGFIYVNAGCRGRDHGAPAGVTDLKAAIRYIRYNENNIAGNSDRIFTFGMSGGGAQSALLGATGDSDLYAPYLKAIGAVENESDAVLGSMCWCPITNLDYANEAYEWNMGMTRTDLTDEMKTLSESMAKEFAQYFNKLELKDEAGNILSLTESENGIYMSGSYYDYLKSVIEDSLNNFLNDTEFPYTPKSKKGHLGNMPGGDMGMPLPDDIDFAAIDGIDRIDTGSNEPQEEITYNSAQEYIDSLNKEIEWVKYDAETNTASITSVEDFTRVCKKASKGIGAFDDLNAKQGENTLFGYGDGQGVHFDSVMSELLKDTQYGEAYAADIARTDALGNSVEYRMNMYNPMYYLNEYYEGYKTSNTAQYWRIRTGISQGDTALTTEVNLALALENCGKDVDFETIWGEGHTMAERTGNSTDNFIAWVNECLENE